jgi:hypothetical protein
VDRLPAVIGDRVEVLTRSNRDDASVTLRIEQKQITDKQQFAKACEALIHWVTQNSWPPALDLS